MVKFVVTTFVNSINVGDSAGTKRKDIIFQN